MNWSETIDLIRHLTQLVKLTHAQKMAAEVRSRHPEMQVRRIKG